jgi:hypothetical protein
VGQNGAAAQNGIEGDSGQTAGGGWSWRRENNGKKKQRRKAEEGDYVEIEREKQTKRRLREREPRAKSQGPGDAGADGDGVLRLLAVEDFAEGASLATASAKSLTLEAGGGDCVGKIGVTLQTSDDP